MLGSGGLLPAVSSVLEPDRVQIARKYGLMYAPGVGTVWDSGLGSYSGWVASPSYPLKTRECSLSAWEIHRIEDILPLHYMLTAGSTAVSRLIVLMVSFCFVCSVDFSCYYVSFLSCVCSWGCWGATSHLGSGCMLFLPLCLTFLSWGVQSDAADEGFV